MLLPLALRVVRRSAAFLLGAELLLASPASAATTSPLELGPRMYASPAEYLGGPTRRRLASRWAASEPHALLGYDLATLEAVEFVPSSTRGRALGLYVHLSASPRPAFPPGWVEVLEERRLFGVALPKLPEPFNELSSVGLALDAIATMLARHPIEASRVVVGGVRLDGLAATLTALHYPEHVSGSISFAYAAGWHLIYSAGVNYQAGELAYADFAEVTLPLVEKNTRFTFVLGELTEDYIGPYPRSDYETALRAAEQYWWRGLSMRVFDVPGMRHIPRNLEALGNALDWAADCIDAGSFPPRFNSDHWPPFTPIYTPRAAPNPCRRKLSSPPLVADAGPDRSVRLGDQLVLDGFIPGQPEPLRYAWEGQGVARTMIAASPEAPAITVVAHTAGVHEFRLLVSGPQGTAEDAVRITVTEPPEPTPPWVPRKACAVAAGVGEPGRGPGGAAPALCLLCVAGLFFCRRRLLVATVAALPLLGLSTPARAALELDVPLTHRMHASPEAYFTGAKWYMDEAILAQLRYAPEEITALRYVPSGYRADGPPAALYVNIDASDVFELPDYWYPVLDELGVLLISPYGVGNSTVFARRAAIALDAMTSMQAAFNIDPGKIIIGGVSGGGSAAIHIGAAFPRLFVGTVSHARGVAWQETSSPNRDGGYSGELRYLDSLTYTRPLEHSIRFAFVSGEHDVFSPTSSNYEGILLETEGWWFRNIRLRVFDVPGMAHQYAFADALRSALTWLITCEDDGKYQPRFGRNHAPPITPIPWPRVRQPRSCDQNRTPVAVTAVPARHPASQPLVLDAAASFDPDGGWPQPLRFRWEQLSGPAARLSHRDSPAPVFTPEQEGVYEFSLVVSDGEAASEPTRVSIEVVPAPPRAPDPLVLPPFEGDISCASAPGSKRALGGLFALLLVVATAAFARLRARTERRARGQAANI